ncbi:Dipeptidyl peptidase 1 [Nymphon striatum]|nr:Dipeptidyl peptidase 1 [Nymphon striatum]
METKLDFGQLSIIRVLHLQKIELPKPGLDDVRGGKSWKATVYPQFEDLTTEELILRAGGPRSRSARSSESDNGAENFGRQTSRILRLEKCFWEKFRLTIVEAAYAFASMAMLEARLRIATNNKNKVILSPQDIVGCSEYSQGGFPYLIAGKYAQDFGVVSEKCFHYKGHDTKCLEKKKNCTRYYVSDYNYVGGYYGATNEIAMKAALVKNGPIAVSFEVTPDFMTYRSGIYHENNPNPKGFQATNHAVLAVGYGVDKATGTNYWIIKNSWGKTWGENGFFRIRRGKDDLHIESCSRLIELSPPSGYYIRNAGKDVKSIAIHSCSDQFGRFDAILEEKLTRESGSEWDLATAPYTKDHKKKGRRLEKETQVNNNVGFPGELGRNFHSKNIDRGGLRQIDTHHRQRRKTRAILSRDEKIRCYGLVENNQIGRPSV